MRSALNLLGLEKGVKSRMPMSICSRQKVAATSSGRKILTLVDRRKMRVGSVR